MRSRFNKLKDDIKRWMDEQNRPKPTPQSFTKNGATITNSVPLNAPPIKQKQTASLMSTKMGQGAPNFLNKAAPTIKGLASKLIVPGGSPEVIRDYVIQPTVRAFVEGGKTISNQRQPEYPKPGVGQFLMGKEPIRHYKDPDRPAQKLARDIGKPGLAMPLILGGAALDAVPVGVDDVLLKGGKAGVKGIAKKGGDDVLKKLVKEAPEMLEKGGGIKVPEISKDIITSRKQLRELLNGMTPSEIKALKKESPDQYKRVLTKIVNKLFPEGLIPEFRKIKDTNVPDYEHFLGDKTRREYIKTFEDTFKNQDIKFSPEKNKYYFIKKYFDPDIRKDIWDLVIQKDDVVVTKFPRKGNQGRGYIEKRLMENSILDGRPNPSSNMLSQVPGTGGRKFPGLQSTTNDIIPSNVNKVKSSQKLLEEESLFKMVDKTKEIDDIYEKLKGSNRVANKAKEIPEQGLGSVPVTGKDIGAFRHSWSDVFRNFRKVFGEGADNYGSRFMQRFDDAKRPYVDDTTNWANALNTNIVQGLGIKPKSKLSALTQKYGEKLITLDELKRRAPKDWEKVVKADEWFRTMYDDLLEQVNASRRSTYPNNPEKIIPKRADYYRHFKELTDGYKGLINIFDTPAQIPAELVGVSDLTKPFSKYLPFAQKRLGNKTEYDAVTGFVNYIKSAAYAKNIDPQIKGFYELADELRELTGSTANKEVRGSMNHFIEFVEDFARGLSGKTNPLDRGVQKFTGRKVFHLVNWMNQRVKVNMVLGNIASSINQFAAIPYAMADAGPANSIKAVKGIVENIIGKGIDPRKASTFVGERYLDEVFDVFDVGMLKYPKKTAKWMLSFGDKVATNFTFHAEYEAALSKGLKGQDAINFAQNRTRDIVAGRGIGEVPIGQQAKTIQMIAPFQLEVANQWLLAKEWIDEKTFGKFVALAITAHVFNESTEKITGNRILPDPFEYLGDGIERFQEEGGGPEGLLKLGTTILGGYASQVPGASNLAGFLPDDKREDWFGEQDPGRYGAGSPLTKAISKSGSGLLDGSASDLITYFGLPFGGAQVRKALGGLRAVDKGGVMNDKGELSYPLSKGTLPQIQAVVFGPYANENARLYFKEDLYRLSTTETARWSNAVKNGQDPVLVYKELQRAKITKGMPAKLKKVMNDRTLSPEQKSKQVQDLVREYQILMGKLGGEATGVLQSGEGGVSKTSFVPVDSSIQMGTSKKKGRKPAAPKMPKLKMEKAIKGSYSTPKYPSFNYDITFLKEQGVMPEFSFK